MVREVSGPHPRSGGQTPPDKLGLLKFKVFGPTVFKWRCTHKVGTRSIMASFLQVSQTSEKNDLMGIFLYFLPKKSNGLLARKVIKVFQFLQQIDCWRIGAGD